MIPETYNFGTYAMGNTVDTHRFVVSLTIDGVAQTNPLAGGSAWLRLYRGAYGTGKLISELTPGSGLTITGDTVEMASFAAPSDRGDYRYRLTIVLSDGFTRTINEGSLTVT